MSLEEPDRVPFDIELCDDLFRGLCKHYNIEDVSVSRYFTYGVKLLRALQSDMLAFDTGPPEGWGPTKFPDGSYLDEWGIRRRFRFKGTIDWFEEHPVKDLDSLEAYEFPNPSLPGRFKDLESALKRYHGEFAILAGIGFSLWERAWTLHGFQQSLTDFHRRPAFMERFLDRIVEYDVQLARIIVEYDIDAFHLGDDYGGQQDLLFPPDVWRRSIKPRLAKIVSVGRKKGLPVVLHTCGNVMKIVKDLTEIGITVLNPVQPRAMDPMLLKQRFGHLLCFYGTVDLQHTLRFGTPQDVRDEVAERIKTVGAGGGLILAPAHTVPPDVPVANLLSLVKAVKDLGKYGA